MNDREKEVRNSITILNMFLKSEAEEMLSKQLIDSIQTLIDFATKSFQAKEELDTEKVDGDCYYCQKRTNSLSCNPSEWNIPLPHKEEPGKCKPHHVGCVIERLDNVLPKITEEELREALPQQEDYEKSQEDKVRNITLDDCFNSISALLKKKGILAQKEG